MNTNEYEVKKLRASFFNEVRDLQIKNHFHNVDERKRNEWGFVSNLFLTNIWQESMNQELLFVVRHKGMAPVIGYTLGLDPRQANLIEIQDSVMKKIDDYFGISQNENRDYVFCVETCLDHDPLHKFTHLLAGKALYEVFFRQCFVGRKYKKIVMKISGTNPAVMTFHGKIHFQKMFSVDSGGHHGGQALDHYYYFDVEMYNEIIKKKKEKLHV